MAVRVSIYTWLQLLSTAILAVLSILAVRATRRRSASRFTLVTFALYTSAAAIWSAGYGLMISVETVPMKLIGWQITVIGTAVTGSLWVVFTLAYAGRKRWLTPGLYALLGVATIGFAGVVAIDPVPTLLQVTGMTSVTDPFGTRFVSMDRSFSGVFMLWVLWIYLLTLAGAFVIVRHLQTSERIYRGQALLLIAGSTIPIVPSLVFFAGVTPDGMNFTSVSFSVTGLCFWAAIRRYRLLDVVPIARQSVIEEMRDGYLVVDDRDVIVDTNSATDHLTPNGEPRVGDAVTDVLPEATDILHGDRDRLEVAVETDDGHRYLEVTATDLSVRDDRGTLLLLQDVTERRATERRYQTLIEHSSDVIILVDPDGTIQYVSPSISHVLGYEPAEVVGENALGYIHPDDRSRVVSEVATAEVDPRDAERVEYRVEHADGSWRFHEAIGRDLQDHPDVDGVLFNARDITNRKRRERQLRTERERLDRFASLVSHDLRNPLNVAVSNLELVSDYVASEGRQYLENAEDSHDRIEAIIDDALAMARDDRDLDTLESVPIDGIARDAWDSVETGRADIEIESSKRVRADRSRLVRAFENLFRNSVEHASQTESCDELVVWVRDVPGGFAVEDNGRGLPEQIRGGLFREGVSGDDSGTGLGLFIVSEIISAHGWSIRAETADTDGARFVVETESADAVEPDADGSPVAGGEHS